MAVDPDCDHLFLAACLHYLCSGHHGLSYPDRFEKLNLGTSQDDVGMVDSDHGCMVRQSENEATVDQSVIIHLHLFGGEHFHPAVALLHCCRSAAKSVIDFDVGIDFHGVHPLFVKSNYNTLRQTVNQRLHSPLAGHIYPVFKLRRKELSCLMGTAIETRLERLRQELEQRGLDAVLVLVEENRRYLSGFSASNNLPDEVAGVLLVGREEKALVTNSLYLEQVRMECGNWKPVLAEDNFERTVVTILKQWKVTKVAFESSGFTYERYRRLCTQLRETAPGVELEACPDLVEKLRLVKSKAEIEATVRALEIAENAFCAFLEKLAPGMTEKQAAWELEKAIRQLGAESLSFAPIVAAGPNSALPHARPGSRVIREGEPLLCDWGARLDGYCSDTSRTVVLGRPEPKFIEIFSTVKQAQEKAVAGIRPGRKASDVDRLARELIDKGPFKGKFTHSLGHGTGLAVHEEPRLSSKSSFTLQDGMLVTVEPGIYLPGWGGVRLENQVLVTGEGGQVLNGLPLSWNIEDYFH